MQDAKDELLDREAWEALSVELTGLDPVQRNETILAADIDLPVFDASEAHWTDVMIAEVVAGDRTNAERYGARCGAVLARRRQARRQEPADEETAIFAAPAAPAPHVGETIGMAPGLKVDGPALPFVPPRPGAPAQLPPTPVPVPPPMSPARTVQRPIERTVEAPSVLPRDALPFTMGETPKPPAQPVPDPKKKA